MAGESDQVGQEEIEQLLRQAQAAGGSASGHEPASGALDQGAIERMRGSGQPTAAPAKPANRGMATSSDAGVSQDDIELLLKKAEQALASIDEPGEQLPSGVKNFRFEDFNGAPANSESATLELMRDVQLDLVIELGRTHMQLEDVLKLRQGAVVALDKMAGDPADIYVNGRLIARGEVLVLNDNFCVRVAELIVGESVCA